MSAIEMQFGELALAFTTEFEFRWSDKGSGGKYDCGFWHPVPPEGFYALGSIGLSSHEDPNGKVAALCVKGTLYDGTDATLGAPLVRPTRYTRIWKDKGTNGKYTGSCWRPEYVPGGYYAMGDVFRPNYDISPDTDDVVCVRADLTHEALAGNLIWTDQGTGANKDFAAWTMMPTTDYTDSSLGLIAANTFVGMPTRTKPSGELALCVLKLPLPVEYADTPTPPQMTTSGKPDSETVPVVDRTVYVPFTAITDKRGRSVQWKVENSPFYAIQRLVSYDLLFYLDNDTSNPQTVTGQIEVGVSETNSETFSVTTGIEVSYSAGVSFIAESEVSMTVSTELGFSNTTSVTEFKSDTLTRGIAAPSGTEAALWVTAYELQPVDAFGTAVADGLKLDVNAFYASQYPPISSGAAAATILAPELEEAEEAEEAAEPALA